MADLQSVRGVEPIERDGRGIKKKLATQWTRRFLFRLAIHVYHVANPDLIPHEITLSQLAESMAYYQLEPWGPARDGLHAAQIAMACESPWAKGRLKLEDYILTFEGVKRPKPNLSEKLRSIAYGIGARIVKRDANAS